MNTSANNAAAVAANFQVTELERRMENAWSQEVETSEPGCIGRGDCAEQL